MRNDIDAYILAGGFGTRLSSVTHNRVPKCLIEFGGRPFIAYQIEFLVRNGLRRVILLTHFLAEQIEARLGDGARYGVEISYSREDRPLGTGGAMLLALRRFGSRRILLLNGDTFLKLDLPALVDYHCANQSVLTVACVPKSDAGRYGSVWAEAGGRVLSFREKTERPGAAGFVNAGLYLIEGGVLNALYPGPAETKSLEKDIVPQLLERNFPVFAYTAPSVAFYDFGTPEAMRWAQRHWRGTDTVPGDGGSEDAPS